MRNAFKHTGVLLMTAIVGLSIIGAAYALWFEDLTLTANVSTGTFDVDWSCEDIENELEEQDCATAIVSLNQGETWSTTQPTSKEPDCDGAVTPPNVVGNTSNSVGDANVLTLSLGNLYPYSGCRFHVNIHNEGTVPAHVQILSATLTCTEGSPAGPCFGTQAELLQAAADYFDSAAGASFWGGTCTDLGVCNGTLTAAQACQALVSGLDVLPGDTIPGIQLHTSNELHCLFDLTLEQLAEEGQTWTITIVYRWHQWNEDQS